MCTLTIHRTPHSLTVTMNRDEARSRGHEIPPHVWDDPAILSPRDSDHGGTWMGLNAEGVTACLLNKYEDYGQFESQSPGFVPCSRGHIVPGALRYGGLDTCATWVRRHFDPSPYLPFTLVLAALEGITAFTWHGRAPLEERAHDGEWTMLSSSFFNTAEVLAWRTRAFEKWLAGGSPWRDGIPAFHLLQPGGWAEWAPLMERDISATRSITQTSVRVGAAEGILRWGPVLNKSVTLESYHLENSLGVAAS